MEEWNERSVGGGKTPVLQGSFAKASGTLLAKKRRIKT